MNADDWVKLQADAIETGPILAHISAPDAGGIAVFIGTSRAEASKTGEALAALDYEAYIEMATSQLLDLAARARAKWPIVRLAIVHRTGRVSIAEPSVLIAVATPHRAEAFEACRWIIDTLKAEAAIWKKEVWETEKTLRISDFGLRSPD